jgi:hypothetical protein
MNARQEAKLTMYRAVEQHCDNNSSIIEPIPALKNALIRFKAKISEIINLTQLTDLSIAGIVVSKSNRKQTLAQKATDIAGIVFAFASATANEPLKQEVNFKLSKLLGTRDDQLAPRCQNIHDKALENLDALKHYGIEEPQLADLQTAINNYSLTTPKPRLALSQRKTYNANLRRLFKESDEILKEQIDNLVVIFRQSNPDFLADYESNRIIIDPAKITTQLKGTVTAQADNRPIKNAQVTIVEQNLSTTTDSHGNYLIKPAPIGQFTLRVTASGFQTFEADEIKIKIGVVNNLDFKLD